MVAPQLSLVVPVYNVAPFLPRCLESLATEPAGTCVCVYDGVVKVGPMGGSMEPVSSGRRRFVFNDGRAPESAEIRPMEITKLGMFRDSRRGFLEGAAR